MRLCISQWLLCFPTVVWAGPPAPPCDPLVAHRLVAGAAVNALPDAIAPWFQARLADFQIGVADPVESWPQDAKTRKRKRWHRVQVDGEAAAQDQPSRLKALAAFPRIQADASRVYRKVGRRRGGELPWAIERCQQRLIIAFRSLNEADIISWAGCLTHFVTDAANPFNVTTNDRGTLTGNRTFGIGRGPHPTSPYYSVRERFFVGLICRERSDIAAGVRMSSDAFEPVLDPVLGAFELIEGSLSLVDEVARADRATLEGLGVTGRQAFHARQDEYFQRMSEHCGDLAMDRIRSGATMAAGLIGGAWRLAGMPPLTDQSLDPPATDPPSARPTSGTLVGSKNSDVFHKDSCPFAARISERNRVAFPSVAAARREGRRPCKRCLPASP